MKKTMKKLWLALTTVVSWVGVAVAANIQYVADNGGGEYSGAGYGISVSVSAPASGYAIKYAESSTGPWQDEPITYRDVCNAKPIYFQILATGYTTVTDSRTVTVTPKTLTSDFVWLVLPTEDYVYDGTAKTPDTACGDGDPSIITPNDFDVSYSDNVDAGTAKATFTGKGNYTGTVKEEFEILKADNEWTTEPAIMGWTYGQAASEPTSAAKVGTAVVTYGTAANPGTMGSSRPTLPGSYVATFTVPESQNYKALTKDVDFTITAATVQYVADDVSGTYSGAGYGIAATISVSAPASGATVKYAESETGPWQDEPITYKDVCNAKPIYFQISATGYTTVTDSRTVTVTPKTLTSDFVWLVLPTEDYVYDGTAKTPDAACGDGDPSIITPDDFDVSYADNVNAGTAKATFTGKGNYTGTVEEEFEIQKADNEWTTEPAMAGWTYGQTPSEPTSAAKDGTAVVTYGTAGTTRPTLPGNYTATFTVPESQNYNALTKDVEFTISPAAINYVADDVSGMYSGAGYGIAATISVSAPAIGAVVKYSESETGPWQEEPITYKDVCNAKPIYFQISATGYTTVTDSRTVTVTPKTLTSDFVWLVLPTEDYVYDGTAKTPDAACGDGDPSIITTDDFDVSYADNVNAGTAKATFTGKGNYTGTVEEEFEIQKADNEWTTEPAMAGWTYGQAPSDPTSAAKHGTATVTYGTAGNPGSLGTTRPTNAGNYAATFTVAASQNYKALTKDVQFAISPKALTATIVWLDIPSGGYTYDGTAKTPNVSFGDGSPSLITENDFDVSYSGNVNAGTATATLTGKRNYNEVVTEQFSIKKAAYDMSGAQWDYAGEFPYDGTVKTVSVQGLPTGVAVASYVGNSATAPGTYTAHATLSYDTTNYNAPSIADLTWTIKSTEESKLREIFNDQPVDIGPDGDGGWKVTLTNDIDLTDGPLEIPDNLGHVTIDLNGHDLIGANGAEGNDTTPGGNGEGAIRVVAGDGEGSVTRISIITTGGNALVKGGDGGKGNPGGNGAPAIEVTNGCKDGVKIDVGADVTVRGGKGGDSTGGRGGDGGTGIVGDVGTNDGTIIGGDGGSSVDGDGGNGGAGVDGNVDVNNGTITGGNGGFSEHGRGGGGGAGVTGDVGTNNGTISGGQGGGTTDGTQGDDGVPVGDTIGGGTGTVVRARVTPPVIAPKEYIGSTQVADVPPSTRWRTAFNEGGTAVASYVVALELTDSVRYKWSDTDNATLYLAFEITKATIDVSAVGWDYSEPLPYTAYPQEVLLTNLPSGVTATYTGNKATETGTYTAHATLNYNTDNYVAAAVPDCVWTIKPAVPIGGGNVDSLGGDTINYSGIYDGEGHGISVILRDPRPAGARVRYSRAKDGPYGDMNPIFTNACRETVWYLVTADNYEALTNSATVTIDPKPLTLGLVEHKGLREVTQDGVATVQPTFVFQDDWPCLLTEDDWELVSWMPKAAGGGSAVIRGRNNYTGQIGVEIGNEMTVLFDAVYGADGAALRTLTTQEPGKPYVFPTRPNYHGHEFLGWFTAKDGGEQMAPGTIVSLSGPDTLYAHWRVQTYRMTFNLNGGNGEVDDFDAAYGSAFGTLPVPTRSGYLFDGWWTTADFKRGTKISEGDGVPFRDTILHAKWERRRLWYTDAKFHLEAAATYDGYAIDPASGDAVAGSVSVKVGKPNKNTGMCKVYATVQIAGEKPQKFKGTTYDGTFAGESKDGRTLSLKLGADSLSGSFGRFSLDGSRNLFKSKDEDSKLRSAQAMKRWQGTYVVAWQSCGAAEAEGGWNGLSIEVKAKGKAKVSGVLADGAKVSAKSQLLVGERECALAVSWTKKGSSVACLVWFCEDGTVECANLPGGASTLIANSRDGAYLGAGAAFRLDAVSVSGMDKAVAGLLPDLLPCGQDVRMNGAQFELDKPGKVAMLKDKSGVDMSKAGANPSGLKLKYKIKNCTFKGSFMAYAIDGGKLRKVKVQVSGVVLGGKGYGTAMIKKVGSWAISIE